MQIGHVTRNYREITRLGLRACGVTIQQRLCIGMGRLIKKTADTPIFHHLTRIHHHHLVTKFSDETKIVGHDHNRGLKFSSQFLNEMNDLGLKGDIQSRGRLICNQQQRIHKQRHGDPCALSHPPAEMMGVLKNTVFRIRYPHLVHDPDRSFALVLHAEFFSTILDIRHLTVIGQNRDL